MRTVAVIFGSRSAEHDVSIVTAIGSIIKPLELSKQYKVEAVYIAKDGAWYWDDKLKDIELFTSGKIDDFLHRTQPASIQFDGGMTLVKASGIAGRKLTRKIDVVFPATHGTYGEDGSLMGLLRMANVPFVGCDLEASVRAMNKLMAHGITTAYNIESPSFIGVTKAEFEKDPADVINNLEALGFPLFTKPVHLGSSIGISRVTKKSELKNALEVVFHYDNIAIVEAEVPNLIEVTVPIMGNDELILGLVEQPLVSAQDFFDFESKYMQGGKKGAGKGKAGSQGYSKLPADLPKDMYKRAEEIASEVYRVIGCSGIARVDLLIDGKTKKIYFNEVNPLPGSLNLHNWRAAGISSVEVVTTLIKLAMERWQQRQQVVTAFSTNYLKQF